MQKNNYIFIPIILILKYILIVYKKHNNFESFEFIKIKY